MTDPRVLTSGVAAFDALLDGIAIGDNLVLLVGDDTPIDWFVDAYVRASDHERLVVVDTSGRHETDSARAVLVWTDGSVGAAEGRAAFDRADELVGTDARVVVDSLTDVAARWGNDEALDLFLVACPRLYRRRSIALWVLRRSGHDDRFLRRLRDVTQVVVAVDGTADRLVLAVEKAAGRPPHVTGRTLEATLVDGQLVDVASGATSGARLGDTIRRLRTDRGVGQAELARRIGISPSALSQAERGVRGVSGETVLRLWEALGVPVDPSGHVAVGYHIGRRTGEDATALAAGVTGRRLVSSPSSTAWEVTVDARARGRGPLFPGKGTETVVLRDGVLDLELGKVTETLQAGDAIVLDAAVIDGWANPADRPATAVWTIAG